jgi:radical SAM protein with 4Fe4S-binding SPASM domain
MLRGDPSRESFFYDTFSPISHITAIEHLEPYIKEIDFTKIMRGSDFSLTQDGNKKRQVNVCPQPFYMLEVNPDGNIVPCCSSKYPGIFGNVNTTGIVASWNSKELDDFRKRMLIGGVKNASDACSRCEQYQGVVHAEDLLDGHEEEILSHMDT